ncbi:hypothetical protein AAU57_02225 [Nonlabens sp. YIK11]|uniref:hypothetical protein n=1 Tax=Nonlabens sp. YIK11 TaxID=1453349 RepID=UPI0006DC687E|nr:hypothetical protein [Nonlabens sp. YIK11]KQC32270.1 hypothetical protein AAU57_02225 [Nonlabens sp. YIK11]
MKVFTKCSNCQNENSVQTSANTRVELAMKKGEEIDVSCNTCGATSRITVDEFYAKPSKMAQILAGVLFLVGTPLVFFGLSFILSRSVNHYVIYITGLFILVPVFAYVVINKQDETRVSDFNSRKLKGRTHNI